MGRGHHVLARFVVAYVARKAGEIKQHVVAPAKSVASYSWRKVGATAAGLSLLSRAHAAA